jgi:ATP-dependent Lon protease
MFTTAINVSSTKSLLDAANAEAGNQLNESLVPWIEVSGVEKELAFIDAATETQDGDKAVKALLVKVLEGSNNKRYVLPNSLNAVQNLAKQFPNFAPVVEFILGELALKLSPSAKPRHLTPLLLLGEPGIGKTLFAKSLALQLGVAMELVSISTATSGFALSGMDRGWRSAHQGKIFSTLLKQQAINPLIVLDEVDKSKMDGVSDPLGPLYQLLEEETAKEFVDEFVGIPINASLITWIITANDATSIPSALLSRMRVFHLKPPNAQQMLVVVENQYRQLRDKFPCLVENLSLDVLSAISRMSPRQAGLQLQEAAGRAALRARINRSGLVKLQVKDIGGCQETKRSIGFTC